MHGFRARIQGKKNAKVRMELVDAIGEVNGDCGLDYNDWIRIGFFDLANHLFDG